jgi:hypothetical protein
LPETAVGFDTALDVALPVFPELVALDWALVAPELPVVADGLTRTVEPPPFPPLALPTETLEPPTAVDDTAGAATTFTAGPPGLDAAIAAPPLPPLPPAATTPTVLVALPVEPEWDVELAPAPVLAELVALPTAVAAPVEPELPELPDVASADAADAPSRSIRIATAEPPTAMTATRTSVRNFAVLICFLTSLRNPGRPLRGVHPGMRSKRYARDPLPRAPPSQEALCFGGDPTDGGFLIRHRREISGTRLGRG